MKIVAGVVACALATMALKPATHKPAVNRVAGGTVAGKVTFTGTAPRMKPIDMAKEPSCAKQHATPVMNESVVTGAGNTLGDVVVYISAGAAPSTPPGTAATFEQKGCQYLPHVLALEAGQKLEVKNDDQTSHNIHPMSKLNPEWNKSQPPGAPPIEVVYSKPEFIPVKCNVHPWMHGYFAVLNTSHSAVTPADGSYSLSGLPPGKYTVTAWQERFGTQSQEVTITGNETAKLDFVLKATEY
ncbi:MAG: carboxypeptidase regulatory-like domain-containing protein [Gemmatimonadaceae bacterium]